MTETEEFGCFEQRNINSSTRVDFGHLARQVDGAYYVLTMNSSRSPADILRNLLTFDSQIFSLMTAT